MKDKILISPTTIDLTGSQPTYAKPDSQRIAPPTQLLPFFFS